MKKCKHQWDYIGNSRAGPNEVMAENPEHAVWICPKCKGKLAIKTGR